MWDLKAVRKGCTRAGIAVISSIAAMYAVIFIFEIIYTVLMIFGAVSGSAARLTVFTELASGFGAYAIAPLVMWLILRRMPCAAPEKRDVKPGRFCKWVLIAIGIDLGIAFISSIVITVFSMFFGGDMSGFELAADEPVWLTILITVIAAPVCEELMFRRILFKRLLPMGQMLAVMVSAVIFGLYHMNFYQFFYAAALGILFGLVMLKTGRLIYTIGLHMAINLLASVSGWLKALPVVYTVYIVCFYAAMAAGIVILIIDVIKKDGSLEAAAFPAINGNWRAVIRSGGMMTCFAVMGAAGLAVTFYLVFI